MYKKLIVIIGGLLLIAVLLTIPLSAQAMLEPPVTEECMEVCPDGGDWVKVDGLSGLEFTYTAPEGKLIAEVCYKAATTCVYISLDPAVSMYTVVSQVFNSPGGVTCTAPGVPHPGCAYQELSHASFRLVDIPTDPTPTNTPTDPPPTNTPTDPPPTNTPTDPPPTNTPTDPPPTNTPTDPPPTNTPTDPPPTNTPTDPPPTNTPTNTPTDPIPTPTSTPYVDTEVETGALSPIPFVVIALVLIVLVVGVICFFSKKVAPQ